MDIVRFLLDLKFSPNERPSLEDIKKRWKKLCQDCHPDRGGKVEEFHRVTHAYRMLTDAEYRHLEMLAEMRRGKRNSKGDLNIRIQVPISFEDGFFGRTVTVSWNRHELDNEGAPTIKEHQDVYTESVRIPPGSVHGYEHLVRDGGHSGGSERGVAYLVFAAMPHARFKVQSYDVLAKERVPLKTMLAGGVIEVVTMYGAQSVRIPPASSPGTNLMIPGCGVAKRGSHVVELEPIFPSEEDLKGSDWRGFDVNWTGDIEPDEEARALLEHFMTQKAERDAGSE